MTFRMKGAHTCLTCTRLKKLVDVVAFTKKEDAVRKHATLGRGR